MKFRTTITVLIVAMLAFVAELVLYPIFGMDAALTHSGATQSGTVFFFFSVIVLTAATGILAPICALVELIVKRWNWGKRSNWGLRMLVSALGTILIGLISLFMIR